MHILVWYLIIVEINGNQLIKNWSYTYMYVHTYVCRIMASQKTSQKCIEKFGPERIKLNASSITKFQLSCIMATYKNERLTKIRS